MFSHEGAAIEVLLFIFGFAGFALALWFVHAYFERKTRTGVKNNIQVVKAVEFRLMFLRRRLPNLPSGWPRSG